MGCGTSAPTAEQQQRAFELAMSKAVPTGASKTTTRRTTQIEPSVSIEGGGDLEFRIQVAHSMPTWCVEGDCTVSQNEVFLLRASWRDVADGHGKPYQQAKELNETITPLVHFYQTFYDMLFELLPEVRPKFKNNMQSQGMMLSKMVAFIVGNATTNDEAFRRLMIQLAARHNEYGIKPEWYSTQGLVLIYSVRKCIGDLFTDAVHQTWVKLLTRMYRIILPTVRRGVRTSDLKDVKLYQAILEDSIYDSKDKGKDVDSLEEKDSDDSIYKSPSTLRHKTQQSPLEGKTPGGGNSQQESPLTSPNPSQGQGQGQGQSNQAQGLTRRNTHANKLPHSSSNPQLQIIQSPQQQQQGQHQVQQQQQQPKQEEGLTSSTLPGAVPTN